MNFSAATMFSANDWFSSSASAGVLTTPVIVLDATEGIGEQDMHYAQLVRFLDLADPIVLVTNLDLIGYEQDQFELIQEEFRDVLAAINLTPSFFGPLPLGQPDLIPWWREEGSTSATQQSSLAAVPPLRMKVVSSTSENGTWAVTGYLLSGTVTPGDQVMSSPSNQKGMVQTVSDSNDGLLKLTFEAPHFVEPGEVISHHEAPPVETDVFRVKALWSGEVLAQGDPIVVETVYGTTHGAVQSVEQIMSPSTFKTISNTEIAAGCLVELIVRVDHVVAIDHIGSHPEAAEIKLFDVSNDASLLAVGHISMEGYADQRHLLTSKAVNTTPIEFAVGERARASRNGHEGGVLWFTGLSGSGKSTLAVELEARLFEKGYQVFVLDGDNVRQGLTSNLGFSPDDRSENIRRVGEVAALFRQAGVIVISSFISPYRSDRDRARHAAYSSFHEVYIRADIETCIKRDPKGLYERALKGDIPDFTGISAPYEAPDTPELVVDTGAKTIEACVEQLVNYVDRNFRV
ncbi:adenylyl-sulfate kinase [Parvibaculaceae bacterium PLY_AMNH_Bact1]|nr:adenylyl-sulfate kinase [Parvibaculaceae bacterium PLY_AMNH_Bact1]